MKIISKMFVIAPFWHCPQEVRNH